MKYFVIYFVALFALGSTDDAEKSPKSEMLKKVRKACVEEKNVSPEHIEKFLNLDYPDDEITRCYIECVFERMELFDPKDGFKLDNFLKQLNDGQITDSIKEDFNMCADKNEQKSDSCTWAYRGFQCFITKNPGVLRAQLKQ